MPFATTPVFEAGVDPRAALPRYRSVAWPSRGLGLVSVLSEPDGITRGIPVVLAVGPALMRNFAREASRVDDTESQR
jgi:hypothetical protein